MSAVIIGQALNDHATWCAELDHRGCESTHSCELAVVEWTGSGHHFDARRRLLDSQPAEPDHTWSTTALLRLIHDVVDERSELSNLRRSLLATSTLARLAERGLGSDIILRTCLGGLISRRAVTRAAYLWHRTRVEHVDGDTGWFTPWLGMLDDDSSLRRSADSKFSDVLVVASQGSVGRAAARWVSEAAVAHVVGYRVSDYLVTDVRDSDRILSGGEDATIWVSDRLTKTYLDDWAGPSLEWEVAYRHDPEAVTAVVGIDSSTLLERHVPLAPLHGELTSRLLARGVLGRLPSGLEPHELVEALVQLARDGNIEAASDLARRAARQMPRNRQILVAAGFCVTPQDLVQARSLLERPRSLASRPDDGVVSAAIEADLATVAIVRRDLPSYRRHRELASRRPDVDGWFWNPALCVLDEWSMESLTIAEWLDLADEAEKRLSLSASS